jgi:cell division protein FtsB
MKWLNTGGFRDIFRKFANYIAIVIIVFFLISVFNGISRINRAESKIEDIRQEIISLEAENKQLEADLEVSETEAYLEKQLRDGLGYAKDGEYVVVLPDEEILRNLAPKLKVEEQEQPRSNWQKWAELFGISLN